MSDDQDFGAVDDGFGVEANHDDVMAAADVTHLSTVTPWWAGWLLLGVPAGFIASTYQLCFLAGGEPQDRWFAKPDDIDLWAAMTITTLVFGLAGAAMVATRTVWLTNRSWSKRLKAAHPDEPWRWRADWDQGVVRADRAMRPFWWWVFSVLGVLASLPGLERAWMDGWRWDVVTVTSAAALALAVIVFYASVLAWWRRRLPSGVAFHMASCPGVLGGPIEGAIRDPRVQTDREYVVRLVAEKHQVIVTRSKADRSVRHELKIFPRHEQSYRATAENGLLPVRFGVPYEFRPSSTEWLSPSMLWFVELEDLERNVLGRFLVPVFETDGSDPEFTLGESAADRAISEETPVDVLNRCGLRVQSDAGTDTVTIHQPAGLHFGTGFWLFLFGVICWGSLAGIWVAVSDEGIMTWVFRSIFGFFFGLIGLVLCLSGYEMMFTRRRVVLTPRDVTASWRSFGLGKSTTRTWDDIHRVETKFSSGSNNNRRKLRNVVAVIDGFERPNGRKETRRWPLLASISDEASEAAEAFLQQYMSKKKA